MKKLKYVLLVFAIICISGCCTESCEEKYIEMDNKLRVRLSDLFSTEDYNLILKQKQCDCLRCKMYYTVVIGNNLYRIFVVNDRIDIKI